MESRVRSQPGDVVVLEQWAQNGFANTDLDAQLKQHGIQKIVLVGFFIANSCVEATGRFGMELGYHVPLIKDATAAFNTEGMTAARVNALLYAHAILTTNELLAALPAPVRKATACEIGDGPAAECFRVLYRAGGTRKHATGTSPLDILNWLTEFHFRN